MPSLRYFAVAAMLMFFAPPKGVAQEAQFHVPAQYSAVAVGRSGATIGKTFDVKISVYGITSDADRDRLMGALKQNGQHGLVSVMGKAEELGRVAPVAGVGIVMHVVVIRPTADGGEHIVLATDRPLSFGERYRGSRSLDYPIGVVTLDVDKNGKGSGSLAPVCKVGFDKNMQLEVEHYGQKPFTLTGVYRQK
jgi:hypothetical protein